MWAAMPAFQAQQLQQRQDMQRLQAQAGAAWQQVPMPGTSMMPMQAMIFPMQEQLQQQMFFAAAMMQQMQMMGCVPMPLTQAAATAAAAAPALQPNTSQAIKAPREEHHPPPPCDPHSIAAMEAEIREYEKQARLTTGSEDAYVGVFTRYLDDEGFGFIQCSDCLKPYGKDLIFINGRTFLASDIEIGDTILFQVVRDSKGLPRAYRPQPLRDITKKKKLLARMRSEALRQTISNAGLRAGAGSGAQEQKGGSRSCASARGIAATASVSSFGSSCSARVVLPPAKTALSSAAAQSSIAAESISDNFDSCSAAEAELRKQGESIQRQMAHIEQAMSQYPSKRARLSEPSSADAEVASDESSFVAR